MKTAIVATLVALALVSNASAIIRPRLPRRTYPPRSDRIVAIIDDSLQQSTPPQR